MFPPCCCHFLGFPENHFRNPHRQNLFLLRFHIRAIVFVGFRGCPQHFVSEYIGLCVCACVCPSVLPHPPLSFSGAFGVCACVCAVCELVRVCERVHGWQCAFVCVRRVCMPVLPEGRHGSADTHAGKAGSRSLPCLALLVLPFFAFAWLCLACIFD